MSSLDRRIVTQDLTVALSNVAVGVMMAGTVTPALDRSWLGVVRPIPVPRRRREQSA
ncbi:hypothetical protein [Salinigranum sp. GCM10025319]|uniref:hypothetical protein n=1 Tax=Salinigranum sp. GCM10025319 TaxID=3252687 RepID=UPI00360BDBBD